MDTFSLSLSIGTFGISKQKCLLFCFLVGILHFIMPLFGTILGNKISIYLNINTNVLLGIILIFIGIEMILEINKNNTSNLNLNLLNLFLLAITVSIDSFSTGLGINAITNDFILSGLIFSTCASSFTFLGLLIGKYCSNHLGIYANILGISLLFILGIIHLLK